MDLVHSQETRRILDRIIGFRLSKLMQKKTDGKSAGRVQSVALKLIVDREKEIEDFITEEYYTISAIFPEFTADLEKYKTKKIEIKNEVEANEILSKLSNAFEIENVESKEKNKKSKFPFTTSTLTQMASNRLGFSASKTMRIAQKLYEGIDLGKETVGLISYMRTDSIRISDDFVRETEGFIKGKFGKEYVGYAKKSKKKDNIQDAHEAIRPTNINRTPESIKSYLSSDEYKLYNLIYVRTLASLMADAKVNATTLILNNNDYKFKTTGQVMLFDGYLKVYKDYEEIKENILPDVENYKSNVIVSKEIIKEQHFTNPPSRYTEASLIKELEKLGIGRPSTYAKIIDILKERLYINIEDKKFYPTSTGINVTSKLQEYFDKIINVEYTRDMEIDLDKIADGNIIWYEVLDRFYKDFDPLVNIANKNMEKDEPETTGEICPECGKDLVIRRSKFGSFIGCSGYPECSYIKKEQVKITEICDCPKCGGKIIEKKTKRGKIFYACNNYPTCNYALWDKPTGEVCEECKGLKVSKKDKIYCPNCDKEK